MLIKSLKTVRPHFLCLFSKNNKVFFFGAVLVAPFQLQSVRNRADNVKEEVSYNFTFLIELVPFFFLVVVYDSIYDASSNDVYGCKSALNDEAGRGVVTRMRDKYCTTTGYHYLLSHDFQVTDVILETRFPQTELIPHALQLRRQLLFILHRLLVMKKSNESFM